jgi:hypothetical protein
MRSRRLANSRPSAVHASYKYNMAKRGRPATEEERVHAVNLIESGTSPDRVAQILETSRSSVSTGTRIPFRWVSGVVDTVRLGPINGAVDQQMMQLRSMIVGRPGLDRADLPLDPGTGRQEGATIVVADEAGFRTDHHAGTTVAPIGCTPVVTAIDEKKAVTMISAVSPRGQLHVDVVEERMNATRFLEFCEKLCHDGPTPVFLIVDGSSAHTAQIVKNYVLSTEGRLRLFFPPYSPELNPDE